MLTGAYAGAAMTGKIGVDIHAALVSHINALLGSFMLFGLAYSLPLLRYTEVGATRLAMTFIVATYANWFLTAVKAALHVAGIEFMGGDNVTNDFMFMLLTLLVVLPSLAGSFFWYAGFKKEQE
jgi:hydroxylaminobenzene mutase